MQSSLYLLTYVVGVCYWLSTQEVDKVGNDVGPPTGNFMQVAKMGDVSNCVI